MKIVEIREHTHAISSPIRNAYIDFSKMTLSLVAVVTDVVRDGRRVVGYGFNSNGRYGQGSLMRERFIPRLLEADPATLVDDAGENLDPQRIWARLFMNEKPGGHGERSVAIGTIDMAVWDAVAKIASKPLFQLLAERYGSAIGPRSATGRQLDETGRHLDERGDNFPIAACSSTRRAATTIRARTTRR